jgi:hypothetical protein
MVVENQIYQFREIQGHLRRSQKFEVFPSVSDTENAENTFIPFMDAVRIYLNPSYEGVKSQTAADRIVASIKTFDPELFVVDHILVGNYKAFKGTYLARQLLAQYGKPIVFLSRTDPNKQEIKEDLEYLSEKRIQHEWVGKGFSGLPILERSYFEKCVIDVISRLLGKSERDLLLDKIEQLASSHNDFEDLKDDKSRLFDIFETIKERGSASSRITKCIVNFEFIKYKTTKTEIETFARELFSLAESKDNGD